MKLRHLLPKAVRSTLISRLLKFDPELPSDIEIKIATTMEEFEQAFKLLHDCYVGLGIMDPDQSGLRCNVYSAIPYTNVVIAKRNNQVIATLSLIQDSVFGLPCDKEFKFENDQYRAQNMRLVEVSAMAVHKDFRKTQGGSYINLFMMNYLYRFTRQYLGGDLLIAAIHPHAQVFYETLFNFKRSGHEKKYNSAKGAPAVHMSMDINTVETYLFEKYGKRSRSSNLFQFIFRDEIPNFNFPRLRNGIFFYPTMNEKVLEYFFERKTPLFQQIAIDKLELIRSCYRWDRDSSVNDRKFRIPSGIRAQLATSSTISVGTIRNFSLSGCLLSTLAELNTVAGNVITIQFEIESVRYLLRGEIVRVGWSASPSAPYEYGVRFKANSSRLNNVMAMIGSEVVPEATSTSKAG